MHLRYLIRLTSIALVATLILSGAPAAAEEPIALDSEESKTLYAVGLAIAQQLGQLGLSAEELAIVRTGLTDSVLGNEPRVNLAEYGPKIQPFAMQRVQASAAREKAAAADFLAQEAAKPGAVTTESGLILTQIEEGAGASPSASDRVTVHYHGTLRDGTVFDSSVDRGEPATFGLGQVIKCWTEGVPTMKVGGKSRLVCPSDIAYGDQGRPGIPAGAVLVFEVELIAIEAPEPSE